MKSVQRIHAQTKLTVIVVSESMYTHPFKQRFDTEL